MTYPGARDNAEVLERFFGRLSREFEEQAPGIVQVMVEELGSCRLTFPDLKDLELMEAKRQVRHLFNGSNVKELALRFGKHPSTIRRWLSKKTAVPLK